MPSNQANINIGVKYNVDQSSVSAVKKSLQDLQNIKPADFKGSINDLRQVKETAKQVEIALKRAFNVNLGSLNVSSFNQQLHSAGLSVDQIYQQFSKLGAQGQVAFSRMASSVLTTNLQLKQTKSLITSMGETMANTVKWGIASSVMNTFTNSVQQAFQYAKSLDGALTDIRIVTGDSTEQMRQFAQEANKAAQGLGRSTMDYTKAALSFYQQGLSDEEVQTRTQTVLKAQNITGAGQEMADYLTAVWNGYKVANQEAELYVDKLAAVADSSASNMSQLAVAMSKVASTANAMGVPVDNLNAQIATIVATTRQAPESVGNALKTIYARINDIATGADDAQVSLGNYSKQMLDVGFSVLDANGNLRDTGDVIDEIGGKWDTLSREQQIYLARTMAGQRQYNNLIALFDNWGKYTDLVNVSLDAQGTTMEKNGRYMDSLGAKLEQLGTASERVKDALINEDDLKGLASFGTTITNLFANLIQSIGGGGNALLLFGSSLTTLFSGVISKQINNVIVNMQNAKNNALQLQQDIANTKIFGQSQGYDQNTAIKEMVDYKQKIGQFYSIMSTQQINSYNNLVKEVGQTQNQITLLEQKKRLGQQYVDILSKQVTANNPLDSVIIDAQSKLEVLKESIQNINLNSIAERLREVGSSEDLDELTSQVIELQAQFGENAPKAFEKFYDSFNKIDYSGNATAGQVAAVRRAVQDLYSEISGGVNAAAGIDDINRQFDLATARAQQAKQAADDYLSSVQQLGTVKGITDTVGALGRLAGAFNSIKNLGNIWSNESLSGGEKLLQTFMSLGMAVPMVVSSFEKLKTTTQALSAAHLTGNTILKAKIDLEKAEQAAAVAKETLQTKNLAAKKIKQALQARQIATQKIKQALTNNEIAQQKIKNALDQIEDKSLKGKQGKKARVLALQKAGIETDAKGLTTTQAKNILQKEQNRLEREQIALQADLNVSEKVGAGLKKANATASAEAAAAKTAQTGATGALTAAQQALNKAMKSNPILFWIGVAGAIAGVIAGIAKIYDATHMSVKQADEAIDKFNQKLDQTKQKISKIDSDEANLNVEEWEQLSKKAANINALTEEEKTRYYELSNLIAEYNGAAVAGYDEQGNAIIDVNHNLEQTIQLLKDKRQAEIDAFVESDEYRQGVKGQQVKYLDAEKRKAQIQQERQNPNTNIDQTALNDAFYNFETIVAANQDKLKSVTFGQKSAFEQLKEIEQQGVQGYVQHIQDVNKIIEELNKRGISVPQGYLNTFDSIAEQTGIVTQKLAKEEKQLDKTLEQGAKLNFQDLLPILQYSENNQYYQQAKEVAGNATDGIIKGYLDALNDKDGIVAAAMKEAGEDGNYLQIIVDKYLNGQDSILPTLTEAFKKQYTNAKGQKLNLGEYLNNILGDVNSIDFSSLEEKEKAIEEKLQEIFINNPELQKLFNDPNMKKAMAGYIGAFFNLDDIDFEKGTVTIKSKVETAVQGLRDRIQEVIKDKKGQNIDIPIEQLTAILPDDITTEQIDNLKTVLESVYNPSKDLAENLQAVQQAAAGISMDPVTSLGLLSQRETSKGLDDQQTSQLSQELDLLKQKYPELASAIDVVNSKWGEGTEVYQKSLATIKDVYLDQVKAKIQEVGKESQLEAQAIKENFKNGITTAADALDAFERGVLTPGEDSLSGLGETATSLSELDDLLAYGAISGQEFATVLQKVSDTEISNLGLDVDQYEDYVSLLQSTNEELQKNEFLARQVAKANLRISKGTEDLVDNWEDWNKAIQEYVESGGEDILALSEQWGQLKESLSNLFNTDQATIDMLGPDFVANNWDKIQAVKDGVQGAWEDLNSLMSQQLILNAYGVSDFTQLDQDIQDAYNAIEKLNGTDVSIVAGMEGTDDILDAFQTIADGANWTSEQAQAAFSQMGYDVEVQPKEDAIHTASEDTQYYVPPTYAFNTVSGNFGPAGTPVSFTYPIMTAGASYRSIQGKKQTYEPGAYAIKSITSNGKTSGGKISRNSAKTHAPKSTSRGGSGGRGGRGGSGSSGTPKAPSLAKTQQTKFTEKPKEAAHDPYQQTNKSLQIQNDLIEDLQKTEKQLTGKQRLKNLRQQIKAIKEESKLLKKQKDISDDDTIKNSTADLKKRLNNIFGRQYTIKYQVDGSLDQNQFNRINAQVHNNALTAAQQRFKKEEDAYNKYIQNVWNKYTAQQQEAHKVEKERKDNEYKTAQETYKEQTKAAEEHFKEAETLSKDYSKAFKDDRQRDKKLAEDALKVIELQIEDFEGGIKLHLDVSDLRREWLDFEDKFVNRIDDDDFFGKSKSAFNRISSYFDFDQLQATQDGLNAILKDINTIQKGGTGQIYGKDLAAAQKALEEFLAQNMQDLEQIQQLSDEIQQNYLDALDEAKDKMDQQIDQYERINDLIEHNSKLVDLIYGDKAYDTIQKYYNLQKQNNQDQLRVLTEQRAYWQNLMDTSEKNSEAWKKAKENVDDLTDSLNSKLEEMVDNLANQFQNRLNKAIDDMNNKLSGGRGLSYLDQQWDYISDYDDKFLDTFESKMGVDEITRLYQQAVDGLQGSPANQQKMNKLMNDQLKILKQKDHLTQYDLDRAKASLEVEKARMALEDNRYSKTKMRLRRDSQGNYTYQYVADEEKLTDLQAALADAQSNLYNMDKEHYKQTLNDMYDTYKEYLQKMRGLTEEYAKAQAANDEAEMKRIQDRMQRTANSYQKLWDSLDEDQKVTFNNLSNSFADGLSLDKAKFSAEQFVQIMQQNIPQVGTQVEKLITNISGMGGLIASTGDDIDKMVQKAIEYARQVEDTLKLGETSVATVMNATDANGNPLDTDIQKSEELLANNASLVQNLKDQVSSMQTMLNMLSQFWSDNNVKFQDWVNTLKEAQVVAESLYDIKDNSLLSTTTAAAATTTTNSNNMNQGASIGSGRKIATFDTGGGTGTWGDNSGRLAFLHQKELVLNQDDTVNILKAVEAVRVMTALFSGATSGELGSLASKTLGFVSNINSAGSLDQNVHIEANFPNVTQHNEIEQAFENLINTASMYASRYRD